MPPSFRLHPPDVSQQTQVDGVRNQDRGAQTLSVDAVTSDVVEAPPQEQGIIATICARRGVIFWFVITLLTAAAIATYRRCRRYFRSVCSNTLSVSDVTQASTFGARDQRSGTNCGLTVFEDPPSAPRSEAPEEPDGEKGTLHCVSAGKPSSRGRHVRFNLKSENADPQTRSVRRVLFTDPPKARRQEVGDAEDLVPLHLLSPPAESTEVADAHNSSRTSSHHQSQAELVHAEADDIIEQRASTDPMFYPL
jgi:hypothetical protein